MRTIKRRKGMQRLVTYYPEMIAVSGQSKGFGTTDGEKL